MHAQTDGPPEDKTILMVLFQYFNYQLAHHPYCSYADGAGAGDPAGDVDPKSVFCPLPYPNLHGHSEQLPQSNLRVDTSHLGTWDGWLRQQTSSMSGDSSDDVSDNAVGIGGNGKLSSSGCN